MHDVKSPYPRPTARASPHTAAPKSKDNPCPHEPAKPSRPQSPQQNLAQTTKTNPNPQGQAQLP